MTGHTTRPFYHRGSLDVDLALAATAIDPRQADQLVRTLRAARYHPSRGFQWLRQLLSGRTYRLDMMAVPPPGHQAGLIEIGGHGFAPLWHGEVALESPHRIRLRGALPNGESAEVELRVANPGGLLVVKARATTVHGQAPTAKHYYDIFALLRAYSDRPEDFVRELKPLRGTDDLEMALDWLWVTFENSDEGARLVAEARAAEPGDWEQHIAEARTTVRRFLRAMATE